ncbi:MAG: NAD(P)-binding Rossmann-like domain protein, partial [uncultured archaeon A07HN63]
MSRTVVVIGGGIAGLVAARHLAAGGADVTVYEAREQVG